MGCQTKMMLQNTVSYFENRDLPERTASLKQSNLTDFFQVVNQIGRYTNSLYGRFCIELAKNITYDNKPVIFNGGGRNHIETSPLICSVNQWTGFYMIKASVMKELSPFLENSNSR